MTVAVQLGVGGSPVPSPLYDAIQALEVQESSQEPDTLLLTLPVNRTSAGDLQFVGDGTFEPMTNVTLTVTPSASGASPQCVFDGYVLSWHLHLDRTSGGSRIEIWAQDASWLMNVDDKVVEWSGQTEGEVANAIFGTYGFTPADGNTDSDSPSHTPDDHTLLQRATDLQFLRGLARRGGRLCRVACTDTPGSRTGYFVLPDLSSSPAATISFVDPDAWTVDSLDFEWDALRPTEVDTAGVDLTQSSSSGSDVSADSSGLNPLDQRDLATYLGQSSTLLLTAPADLPELDRRAAAVLVESGFFARCTGEADADRLGGVLRVGDVVSVQGAGALQSGSWLVWDVRHRFSLDTWRMSFTLVRNAMGPAAAGGSLGSLAGALGGAGGGPSL